MSRHIVLALAFALVSLPVFGAVDDEGNDEYTIRPSDIPKDAPRFKDYPAKPYAGSNAAPDVRSDPRSRMYRTQLRSWAKEKPNFADHYILATWGCGTGCTQIAVIDALTGKVFHPAGARTNSVVNVHDELLVGGDSSPRRADFGALRYRADSRLLSLIGTPENRVENRGISYFVWENDGLRRIRFVPKLGIQTKVGVPAEERKLLRPVVMELVDRADDVADDRAEHFFTPLAVSRSGG